MVDARRTLAARGLLDGHAERLATASADVRITVLPASLQLNLRVDTARAPLDAVEEAIGAPLPGALSSVTTALGISVVWLGPDEWLVSDPARSATLERRLRAAVGDAGAVVNQSGQRLSLLLDGDARGLLAKGTGLDLDPRVFPEGAAVQGLLAQSAAIFVSRSADGSKVELIVRTSFARYVADWLLDALVDPLAYPASSSGD